MRATFLGFEIAKSGIQTSQTALDITGQNITKMNTQGYSRQEVSQSTVYYEMTSYKYALLGSEKYGQGVSLDSISQVRDDFLDSRYRTANSENAALKKVTDVLSYIEGVFDETINDGLGSFFGEFYARLQNLSLNSGQVDFSGLVRSSAQKITETLSYYYKQLTNIESQEKADLNISIQDINTILNKITTVNNTIQAEKLRGNPTNELLDTRNLYLDNLSKYFQIAVKPNTDGTVSVKAGGEYLTDAEHAATNHVFLTQTDSGFSLATENGGIITDSGMMMGYFEVLNGKGPLAGEGESDFKGIPYYKEALDMFAKEFSSLFNTLNGDGKPLFTGSTALDIKISDRWLADANYITATTNPDPQKGQNDNLLLMLAELETPRRISQSFQGTFEEYITAAAFDAGIELDYYNSLAKTSESVLLTVENQREAVKGVSINEEAVNMLKYQKAFEASARIMTSLDEMLDTIINRMGIVGR